MPAYEYQCQACAIHFERRQKMSEPALETCPDCGGHVKRLISGGAGAITRGASQASGPTRCQMGGGCGGATCLCEESPCMLE